MTDPDALEARARQHVEQLPAETALGNADLVGQRQQVVEHVGVHEGLREVHEEVARREGEAFGPARVGGEPPPQVGLERARPVAGSVPPTPRQAGPRPACRIIAPSSAPSPSRQRAARASRSMSAMKGWSRSASRIAA